MISKIYKGPNAPCKDCPDRHSGCHAECDKYQEYAKYMENERKERDKARQIAEERYFAERRRRKGR